MTKTFTERKIEEFKKLRTCDLQEAEAILEDGTRVSDFLTTALNEQREEMLKEIVGDAIRWETSVIPIQKIREYAESHGLTLE